MCRYDVIILRGIVAGTCLIKLGSGSTLRTHKGGESWSVFVKGGTCSEGVWPVAVDAVQPTQRFPGRR